MHNVVTDFLTGVTGAQTATDVHACMDSLLHDLGFAGSVYRTDRRSAPGLASSQTVSDNLQSWHAAYESEGDGLRDPLFRYHDVVPTLFHTGAAFMDDYPYLAEEDLAVINRARDYGLISGLCVKVPNADLNVLSGWNLLSGMNREEITSVLSRWQDVLHVSAVLAQREMERVDAVRSHVSEPLLSPREKECLLWLCAGLRNERIAERMGIRPVTVELHLRHARQKLGAQTREQALAIALLDGHISP